MPSFKLIAEKLFEGHGVSGWTAYDQLEELKGKLHLKSKDKDAYQEGTNVEKRQHESSILKFRHENKHMRKEVKAKENGHEYVINGALKDDRPCLLSLSGLTAEQAVTEMDYRASEAAKNLDLWVYERNNRETELKELQWELEHLEEMQQVSPCHVQAEQDVVQLENATDKVNIKINTARILYHRYHEILRRLKKDNISLPAKLDAMEVALIHSQSELSELQRMAKESFVLRDKANEEQQAMQQKTLEDRRDRVALLNDTKAEVSRRKEDLETKERPLRAPRPTLTSDSTDYKTATELQRKRTMQKKLLTLEDFFNKIREATHVSELDNVVSRVVKQNETHKGLQKKVQQLENQRSRLMEDQRSLQRKFRDMKYSGEQKLSRGQRTIQELQDTLHKYERDNGNIRENLKKNGETLVNIKEAVTTLSEKLNEIKLPPPEHSYPRGDVFAHLDLAVKKLGRLMKEVGATDSGLKEKLQNPEFQEFLLKRVGSDNVRIKLHPSVVGLHEFDPDLSNDGAPSRNDIKLQGQLLMESKFKPKKKKPSTRKK